MTFLHKHPGLHMKVKVGDMIKFSGGIRVIIEKLPPFGGQVAILTIQAPLEIRVRRILPEDQVSDESEDA